MSTESILAAIGSRTVRDIVRDALAQSGLEETVGFELKLSNGTTVTIVSDKNPILDQPASAVVSATPKSSAAAGGFKFVCNF